MRSRWCGRSTASSPSSSTPPSARRTPSPRSSAPSRTRARWRRSKSWHEAGHFIHITSHRAVEAHGATAQWLEQIGLPYDELYCSNDKVTRCEEIGIDLLIDDSPETLQRAIDAGITVATLEHPWNRELCETEDVICGKDWAELARNLDPVLDA